MMFLFMSMHYIQYECCQSTHLRGPSHTMQNDSSIGLLTLESLTPQLIWAKKKKLSEFIDTQSWYHQVRNSIHLIFYICIFTVAKDMVRFFRFCQICQILGWKLIKFVVGITGSASLKDTPLLGEFTFSDLILMDQISPLAGQVCEFQIPINISIISYHDIISIGVSCLFKYFLPIYSCIRKS